MPPTARACADDETDVQRRHLPRHPDPALARHRRDLRDLLRWRAGARQRARGRMDMLGEIVTDAVRRASGSSAAYRTIRRSAAPVVRIGERELRLIFDVARPEHHQHRHLQQDRSIGAYVDVEEMVQKHFAIFGSTGAGKSSAVALILREIMAAQMDLRVLLIDPHNEYAASFEDKAHVLRPGNLRLPFWLFNFDELVEVIFGRRPDVMDEIGLLSELIPLAKNEYARIQGRRPHQLPPDRARRRPLHRGLAGALPDGGPGRAGRQPHGQAREPHRRARATSGSSCGINTVRKNPRYAFIFDDTHADGDSMVDILCQLAAARRRRPADDHRAARRLPGRGVRRHRLGAVPPRLRIRAVERRRDPAARGLRGGASIRQLRSRRGLSAGARGARAHRQGGPQVRRVPRPRDAAPGADRPDAGLAMQRPCSRCAWATRPTRRSCAPLSPIPANRLLGFLPALGTREALAFGAGVPVATRLRFKELPERASSRAAKRSGAAAWRPAPAANRDLVASVVARWRGVAMSNKPIGSLR